MQYVELQRYASGVPAAIIPNYIDLQSTVIDNEPGSIVFNIPKIYATSLVEGTEVGQVIDGTEVERYIIEGASETEVDGLIIKTISGRTTLAYLEDAIVYPSSWPSAVPSGHAFVNATAGQIMKTLMARAKSLGYLTFIDDTSFSASTSSSGKSWNKIITVTYPTGTTLLQVVADLSARGLCDVRMVGRKLYVYDFEEQATVAQSNQLPDPGFETGIGGFSGTSGATIARSSDWAASGTYSLKMTATASDMYIHSPQVVASRPYRTYSFTFTLKAAPASGKTLTAYIQVLDSATGNISTLAATVLEPGTVSTTTDKTYTISGKAPYKFDRIWGIVRITGATVGQNYYIDNASLHEGSSPSAGIAIVVRRGKNLAESGSTTDAKEFASTVLIEGDDGVITEVNDASAASSFRKKAKYVQQGGVNDLPTLGLLGQFELDVSKVIREEISLSLTQTETDPMSWFDFSVGEWIYVDRDTKVESLKVKQISLGVDANRNIRVGLTVKDLIDSNEEKIRRKIDAYTGGGSGSNYGPIPNTIPDLMPPAVPASLTLNHSTYTPDSGGALADVELSWPAVTTNSDGTPLIDLRAYEAQYTFQPPADPSGTPISLTPVVPEASQSIRFDRKGKAGIWAAGVLTGSTRVSSGKDIWSFGETKAGPVPATGTMGTIITVKNSMIRTDPADYNTFEQFVGRPNLLSSSLASVETGTPYVGTNATVTFPTEASPRHGTKVVKAVAVAASAYYVRSSTTTTGITAGSTYSFMAYAKKGAGAATADATIKMEFQNSGGAVVGTAIVSSSKSINTTNWTRVFVSGVAPVGATRVHIYMEATPTPFAIGDTVYWDCMGLHFGNVIYQGFSMPGRTSTYDAVVNPESVGLSPTSLTSEWMVPNEVTVINTNLYIFYGRFGTGNVFLNETYIVYYDAGTLELLGTSFYTGSDTVVWGTALYETSDYTYIFGSPTGANETYLMRVPRSNLFGTKEFRTSSGWSTTRASAVSIAPQKITAVKFVGSQFYGFYLNAAAPSLIGYYTCPDINVGSWTLSPSALYTVPEGVTGSTLTPSAPKSLDQFDSATGGLQFAYSVVHTAGSSKKNVDYTPRVIKGPALPPDTSISAPVWVSLGQKDAAPGTNTMTAKGLPLNMAFQARVRAIDTRGNVSGWRTSSSMLLTPNETPLVAPSAPRVSPTVRGIYVEWDGLNQNGDPIGFV